MADESYMDEFNQRSNRLKDIGGGQYAPVRAVAGWHAARSAVALTRTADTNAYTAGDVIGVSTSSGGGVLTFSNVAPTGGGHIMITGASLLIESSAVISGETSYTLHLYSATPGSAYADNAAWDLPSGDRASYLGSVSLGAPVDLGSTLWVRTDQINMQVQAASTSLFGYLVTVGGYTPASARVYNITLRSVGL